MTGFYLLTSYLDDPEVLLRKAKASLKKVLTLESKDNRIRSLTPEFEAMANRTLHEFSAPTTTNIHTGPPTDVGENGFELLMLNHRMKRRRELSHHRELMSNSRFIA
jgi:hypothetical protein